MASKRQKRTVINPNGAKQNKASLSHTHALTHTHTHATLILCLLIYASKKNKHNKKINTSRDFCCCVAMLTTVAIFVSFDAIVC